MLSGSAPSRSPPTPKAVGPNVPPTPPATSRIPVRNLEDRVDAKDHACSEESSLASNVDSDPQAKATRSTPASRIPVYGTQETLERLSAAYGGGLWPELGAWDRTKGVSDDDQLDEGVKSGKRRKLMTRHTNTNGDVSGKRSQSGCTQGDPGKGIKGEPSGTGVIFSP